VLAPDRDAQVGVRPLVSVREDDEPDYVREVERRAHRTFALRRRGVDHGVLVELKLEGLVPGELRKLRRRRKDAIRSERWHAARPISLPEAVPPGDARALRALHRRLSRPDGLAELVEQRAPERNGFTPLPAALPLADPERDLARVGFTDADGAELWAKTGRLSRWEGDRSLRLRVSAGEESAADASRDEDLHRRVAALGRCLLPDVLAAERPAVRDELERLLRGEVLLTQPIGYWNAPEGGARFHHDAFDEELVGGQRGVVYVQLAGETVWLALSIADLAERAAEVLGAVAAGELPGLAEDLGAEQVADLVAVAADRPACVRELGLPGAGRLGPLVDRGPDFTAFLADAGHALALHPGDALVLPNHGLDRTLMHSVFCGSDAVTFGVSQAIRAVV
jgi:antitoxin (DNA-binding transcriptional repressor) of toxin-antitoxin stability system